MLYSKRIKKKWELINSNREGNIFINNIGSIGDVAYCQINGVLEYFGYIGI